jgi:TRAP-type uncharacterized transport system substrate-binding protein
MIATRRAMLQTMARGGIGVTMAGQLGLLGDPVFGAPAQQQPQPQNRAQLVDQINSNTLMILTAGSGLTYAPLAADLATVLNDGDNLRILPVQGYSAYQNVRDVRYLRGIDMGFTRTNILAHWRKSGEIPDLNEKIVYLFKLCNEEENLLVKSDITSIEQLRGKKVNFNQVGSGTQMSARDIFSHFKVEIQETNLREGDALQKLKDGEIQGMVATGGKPVPLLRQLKSSDGFRLVPIPFSDSLINDYLPATLTHEDYPTLISEGQTVDTLASGIIVIAYNWPKNSEHYRRIDKFVNALFPKLAEFQKPPRHEKWKETILAATIPGVKRFASAEEWVKNDREQELNANREQFQQFLTTRNTTADRAKVISEADRNQLFEDFMKWMKMGAAR